jgi:hypothetical protein
VRESPASIGVLVGDEPRQTDRDGGLAPRRAAPLADELRPGVGPAAFEAAG